MARLEREVHGLRDELIRRHPHRDAFWALPRGGGGAPNVGSMVYRVLTDYEVQVLAQAARVFMSEGVRVATYEYDGMKVSAAHWESLGAAGQDRLLEKARVAIDTGVFAGRGRGVVQLAVKPMGYERYEQRLAQGREEWEAVKNGEFYFDSSPQQGKSGRFPRFDHEEGGEARGEAQEGGTHGGGGEGLQASAVETRGRCQGSRGKDDRADWASAAVDSSAVLHVVPSVH